MRITIEIDERTQAAVQAASQPGVVDAQNAGSPSEGLSRLVEADTPALITGPAATGAVDAQDAGNPSNELLRLMEAEHPVLTVASETADAMDAGSPPGWLNEAIQATLSTSTEVATPAVQADDAGTAPAIEE